MNSTQVTLLTALLFINPTIIGMEIDILSEQNKQKTEFSHYAMRKNLKRIQTSALIELIEEETAEALKSNFKSDESSEKKPLTLDNNQIDQTYKTLINCLEKWTPYLRERSSTVISDVKSTLLFTTGLPFIQQACKISAHNLRQRLQQGPSLSDCLEGYKENHKILALEQLLQKKITTNCYDNLKFSTNVALSNLYKRIQQESTCSSWELIKTGFEQKLNHCHNILLKKTQSDMNNYRQNIHRTISELKNDFSQDYPQLEPLKNLLLNNIKTLPSINDLVACGYSKQEISIKLNQELLALINDFDQLFQPALNKSENTITEIPPFLKNTATTMQQLLKRPLLSAQKPKMYKSSKKLLHKELTQIQQRLNSLRDYTMIHDKAVGILIDNVGPILHSLSTFFDKPKDLSPLFPERLNDLFLAYKIKIFIAKTWNKALQDLNDKKITDSELKTIIQKVSASGAKLSGTQIKSDRIRHWLITGVAECLNAPQEEQ